MHFVHILLLQPTNVLVQPEHFSSVSVVIKICIYGLCVSAALLENKNVDIVFVFCS